MDLPKHVRDAVRLSELRGHALVSQGCSLFRCTRCDERGFLPGRAGSRAHIERVLLRPCTLNPKES